MEQTFSLKNGETLLVRPPFSEDAEACFAYMNRIGGETDFLLVDEQGIPGLTLESERAYLEGTLIEPRNAMFLGFVGNRLVAMFDVRPELGRRRTAHNAVLALSIVKDYWHMGIGTLAMGLLIEAAKERGVKNLILEASAENERAIRLYERFGFTLCGRRKNYLDIRGRYVDQLIMEKEL